MRKLIAILGFIITNVNVGNAQICDSINCPSIKDYVNARITQAYLLDLLKVKTSTSKQDSLNYKKIEATLNSNKLETPLKYEILAKNLNDNNFGKTRELFADPINSATISVKKGTSNEKIADSIVNQLINRLADTQRKKIKQIPALISELNTELITYITSKLNKPNAEPVVKSNDAEDSENAGYEDKASIKKPDNTSFFSMSNFNFFILLLFFALLIVFIILLVKIVKLNDRINNRKSEIEDIKNSLFKNSMSSQQTGITKSDFESLLGNSERFNDFYTKVERLETSVLNATKETQLKNPFQPESSTINYTASNDIFYMTKPVENYFPISAKSLSPSDTVYKFIIGENKTYAEYEIHTQGAPIGEIIKRSETYLVSGCNEENNPSVNANKIVTKIKGQVQLEGDRWIIKRKATIRYE